MNMFEALKEMVPVYNVRQAVTANGSPLRLAAPWQTQRGQRARHSGCLCVGQPSRNAPGGA